MYVRLYVEIIDREGCMLGSMIEVNQRKSHSRGSDPGQIASQGQGVLGRVRVGKVAQGLLGIRLERS